MNNDLISRTKALELICAGCCSGSSIKACGTGCRDFKELSNLPAVDAEVVRHGRWIDTPIGIIKCNLCGAGFNMYKGFAKYCGCCGARMDGGADGD